MSVFSNGSDDPDMPDLVDDEEEEVHEDRGENVEVLKRMDCTVKRVFCGPRCQTCVGCICKKHGEPCNSHCKCKADTCTRRNHFVEDDPSAKWRHDTAFNPTNGLFDANGCGPRNCAEVKTELQAFRLFFDQFVVNLIMEDTERYAMKAAAEKHPDSPVTDAERAEIYKLNTEKNLFNYVAILLTIGLNRPPDVNFCWNGVSDSDKQPSFYGCQVIQSLMPRDLFWAYNRLFHWAGQKPERANVALLEAHLNFLFVLYWTAWEHIVVDEGVIPYEGRCPGRVYIPSKPHDTGIKYFCLADKYNYVMHFFLSQDFRTADEKESDTPNPRSQKPCNVVYCALDAIKDGKSRILITDSYYGSVDLCLELHKDGYRFIMACQCNQPTWLFGTKEETGMHRGLKKHEWTYKVHSSGELIAVSFYDSGRCNFISNIAVCFDLFISLLTDLCRVLLQ